jgi:hypothetical protein
MVPAGTDAHRPWEQLIMRHGLRRLALTGVTTGLLALAAGCGGGEEGGGAVGAAADAVGLGNAVTCTEATAALNAFNSAVTEIPSDDTAAWEAEAKKLSGKLGEIAGKTEDTELKGVLTAMATTWAAFDLDGDAAAVNESIKLMEEQPDKLARACR